MYRLSTNNTFSQREDTNSIYERNTRESGFHETEEGVFSYSTFFQDEPLLFSPTKINKSKFHSVLDPELIDFHGYFADEKTTRELGLQTGAKSNSGELLGIGTTGSVHVLISNPALALKRGKLNKDLSSEYKLGKSFDHRNLVRHDRLYRKQYSTTFRDKLVMERVYGYTLDKLKAENKKFSKEQLIDLIDQLRDCFLYLYQQEVIPSDCNDENILIANDGIVKICDFEMWNHQRVPLDLAQGISSMFFKIAEQFVECSYLSYQIKQQILNDANTRFSLAYELSALKEKAVFEKVLSKNFGRFIKDLTLCNIR